jgi:predicted acylesterase/phospholipase RssA
MNQQTEHYGVHTPAPSTQPYSNPPQIHQNQDGRAGQEYQNPQPQLNTYDYPSFQAQAATYTPQPQVQNFEIINSQPANVVQSFPPPPKTPVTSVSRNAPQQQLQSAPAASSPHHQQQPYSAPHQQNFLNQPQQPQQYLPMVPQQESDMQGNKQYQTTVSPPPPFMQFQSASQENQLMVLQQGFEALSVVPGLSSNFKEVTHPRSTSSPPKRTQRDGTAPSILRVQSDGHASAVRKILCLDGGGVRGLASLVILKHLMQRLETQRGGRLEPWQEFDMIAGTSTGGLIAIMLGRLRMSVEECIETYKTLSQRIFKPVNSKANIAGRAITKLKAEGKFESEPLEQVVKEICLKCGLSETALLKDNSADAPKVLVCAAQGINADAVVIRSYESGSGEWDDLYEICKIWEAARATSAASTFFDPIQIGDQKYVDGALRYNNPIEKADQESRGKPDLLFLKLTVIDFRKIFGQTKRDS